MSCFYALAATTSGGYLGEYLKVFLVGGAFCVVAQILLDKTRLSAARILVGYVVFGVFLGAVGLYSPLAEFAGGGALTPLSGFGYNVARGVREAVDSQGFVGIFSGALTAAAAVSSASLVFGFIASLLCRGRTK